MKKLKLLLGRKTSIVGTYTQKAYDELLYSPVNLVIPMAGAGSRFAVAGYDVPKPFIEFNGKMMIEHVLDSFIRIKANIILVLQENFLLEQKVQLEKLQEKYNLNFVTVPKLTMGAAVTALAAHKKINPAYDIIFADSDNIFRPFDVANFIARSRGRQLSGALLTFSSDNPCFSYAKVDENGLLLETKEKEVISNHAICGMYYFKNLDEFKDAVIDLIICNDLSKGEFYMSNVYNHLKKYTDKIGILDIEHFDCVGTPEQLKEYIDGGSSARVQ